MPIPFLPATASTAAGELNFVFAALLALTGAVLGLVVLLLLIFAIRYRKGNTAADRNHRIKKSWHWEVAWTCGSFVIFLGLYAWGADLYLREHHAPADAVDIYVVGKQWMWKIEHADGQREINTLHVPLGRPVRLVMTSQDVIHGFFVPDFRLKQDVVPGRYVTLWFTPTAIGRFRLFCSQFCGAAHADMGGAVVVMTGGDFEKWLEDNAITGALAARGGATFRSLGCAGCHGPDTGIAAPSLVGLYGSMVRLQSGAVRVADDDFIRTAIVQPAQNPPAGYAAIMPSFAGQIDEDDMAALLAYLKTLRRDAPHP